MRPIKRAIHLDFHTLPGIYDLNEGWDAKEFARILKDANVGYINAFARCNIGFAYYPTKVGIPYPGMKGDMFGDLLRECHKQDIGVTAYMNVGIDQEHAVRHSDWLQMNAEGHVFDGDLLQNFFRLMCYNNPEYNAYHFGMLKEICEYDVDGIFFDCMVVQPCYCYHCQTKMKALGIDANDITANMKFQEQSILEFSKKSKEIIGDEKYFLLNGMHYAKYNDLNTHIEVECLPGAWGYDYFWSRASYARTLTDNVLYMTGRFQLNWGDFGGFKGKESLLNDYYDALCAGVGVSVGDHMNPARNLEKDVYGVIGEMNAWVKELEPYTEKAKFLADIGVIINYERELPPIPNGTKVNGTYMPQGYPGLTRMFGELRQSYDIINENMDFEKYKLLVLPDSVKMNETLKIKLANYLKKGGKVLSTGVSGLDSDQTKFALKEWDFELDGIDKSNSSYYSFVKSDDPKVYNMQYCMYSDSGVLIRSKNELAKYVKSYFQFEWDGIHGYSYTPPEKETGHAAAAVNGDGNVCHISFEVFNAYNKSASYPHKALVKQCLDILLPEPLIKTEGVPSTARVTATGCEDYVLVHTKVTYPELRGDISVVEEEGVLEEGKQVFVKGSFKDAYTLPDKKKLDIQTKDGYTQITLPRIVGYQMVCLETQK